GMLELLLACGDKSGQKMRLFKCPPNDHAWLRVRPRTRFGAPARGAVVKVKSNGRLRIRVIDCGGGAGCQMEPVAHFGLGSDSSIEWLSVKWPDGVSLSMKEVPLRVVLDLPYPG